MIYERISAHELHPKLTGDAVLTVYARDVQGVKAQDGARPAVLICPGGAYRLVSPAEGEPVALALLNAGIQAFVLEYSVAPARWPQQLLEAAAALAYVRRNAARYGVHPGHIAVCGFSAGGHLAGCLASFWDGEPVKRALGLSGGEARPDASILCYPVITAKDEWTNAGSFESLLGEGVPVPPALSLENSVRTDGPPTFLWSTGGDTSVPAENSLLYAGALRRAGVPFELHLYADGPHGMALGTPETAREPRHENEQAASWLSLCVNWLKGVPA